MGYLVLYVNCKGGEGGGKVGREGVRWGEGEEGG